ncbi:hypothetical protein [Dyadobacter aurulentus]|uniref:hypothetical protein n=1 Tax=Dyadobacter sp. UC 10 TaxID=2605428 RepID=UPI0011F3CBFA|nr:hypothetical protein [Dyadobacter sp. UC 10]KAA0989389.1 hypothetical protein FXO21_04075 [Dyadobacter sp. UC 10]
MKKWISGAGLLLALTMWACNDEGLDAISTIDSSFETDFDGWEPGFAEYSTKTDTSSLARRVGRPRLPFGLDTSQYAFMIQSNNHSDDIFMYLKKKVTGFKPNETYSVVFDIDLATNAAAGSVGSGGSPASSVYVKAGASLREPATRLQGTEYTFTLDKGQQSQSGADGIVLGDLSNGTKDTTYVLVKRTNADKPFMIKANASGAIWFYVGTDSGFEGLTKLYYNRIRITAREENIQ